MTSCPGWWFVKCLRWSLFIRALSRAWTRRIPFHLVSKAVGVESSKLRLPFVKFPHSKFFKD